jgi:hypothetical protein
VKLRVEFFMAAASHMGVFEEVIDAPFKTAMRLWRSTFSMRDWSSSRDFKGCRLLEDILQREQPQYRWPVSAVLKVRPAPWRKRT